MAAVDKRELELIFGDDGSNRFDEFNGNISQDHGQRSQRTNDPNKQQRLNTNLVQIPANLLKARANTKENIIDVLSSNSII